MGEFNVAQMIVDRLIAKIESDGRLPWQQPFKSSCMNWYTEKEYMGVNKILLEGGEYITVNQLKEYNQKMKTDYWFEKGTPQEIIVFYNKSDKKLTSEQVSKHREKFGNHGLIVIDGETYRRNWFLRYYRVININNIKDKDGNMLPSKIASGEIVEEHTPSNEIVDTYVKATGVGLKASNSGAYYQGSTDSVYMQQRSTFASTEAYYRVLFHELIHSTGIKTRLARSCYEKYHQGSKERSKEELIAEIGGLLLASEAGFREDTEWAENSLSYVAGWCSWMRENPNEVIAGMTAAEKAKNYILSGGKVITSAGEKTIGEGYKSTPEPDTGAVVDSDDAVTTPPVADKQVVSSDSGVFDVPDFTKLKTKKAAKEAYKSIVSTFSELKTDADKDKYLRLIKVNDLRKVYYILTKENLPKSVKKADALGRIADILDKR